MQQYQEFLSFCILFLSFEVERSWTILNPLCLASSKLVHAVYGLWKRVKVEKEPTTMYYQQIKLYCGQGSVKYDQDAQFHTRAFQNLPKATKHI